MAGAAPRRSALARGESKQPARPYRARVKQAREALAAARDEARTLGRAAQIAEREASRLRADADAADRGVAEAEAALAKLL